MAKSRLIASLVTLAIGVIGFLWYIGRPAEVAHTALGPALSQGLADESATGEAAMPLGAREVAGGPVVTPAPPEMPEVVIHTENAARPTEAEMPPLEEIKLIWDSEKPAPPPLREGLKLFAELEEEKIADPGHYLEGDFKTFSMEGNILTGYWDREGTVLAAIGEIRNGKLEGQWEHYFPNGQKMSSAYFEHGIKTGTMLVWDEDGLLEVECIFNNAGRHHGKCLFYNNDGSLMKESGIYENGVLIKALGK